MLLHSTRNFALNYNYSQHFHPFTLENLENFFKLETFGIELLYLNRRFTLIYFYKEKVPFLPLEFSILEEPENLQLERTDLVDHTPYHTSCKDDSEMWFAFEPHSVPRFRSPQCGLNQHTMFTILGISQEVDYWYKKIYLNFPIECLNLFKLYFQFIEKMLVELQILNNVRVHYVPDVGYGFTISHNGDNFDLKPFEDEIPTISDEESKNLPFCF
jgi:hypothetical protein